MFLALQVTTIVLAAVNLTLSLAHALEFPGKQRLARETYFAVQTIYYPGFTVGAACKPLALLTTLLLLVSLPKGTIPFWLVLAALVCLAVEHGIYWAITHRVNKVWMRDQRLSTAGTSFFGAAGGAPAETDWTALRDRWEYSHIGRAVFAALAFLLVVPACLRST